jgi:maltooligosyltrehalose trehalohydrolase
VFRGGWSAHRQRNHGNSPRLLEPRRFIVYSQTHDQVGNRARGDRHAESTSAAQQRLAAAALLLSPFVPLLFMGQEYGETAPFCFFTSFEDPKLQEAVRAGRQRDFAAFGWRPQDVVDPGDPAAFERSRLTWDLVEQQPHRQLLDLHRELLALRRDVAALREPGKDRMAVEAWERKSVLVIRRWSDGWGAVLVLHFGQHDTDLHLRLARGTWRSLLDTEDVRWGGPGRSVAPVIQSDGAAALRLAATSAVLLANEARE